MTPHTLFQLASNTKVHTAFLAALLVEDDSAYPQVSWQAKLSELDPALFKLDDRYRYESAEITLEDALSHRTGMPRHDFGWVNANWSMSQQVGSLRHLHLSAPLRTKWQYCNLMFTAVAHAIEAITANPIEILSKKWLWDPLNMTSTFYDRAHAFAAARDNDKITMSSHYWWSSGRKQHTALSFDDLPAYNGATGVITNAYDYAKWLRALLKAEQVSSVEGLKSIRRPRSLADPDGKPPFESPVWYGLGLFGGVYHGHKIYFHTGAIGGFFSHVTIVPDLDFGLVVMQNAPTSAMEAVSWRLVDDALSIPADEGAQMDKKWVHYMKLAMTGVADCWV